MLFGEGKGFRGRGSWELCPSVSKILPFAVPVHRTNPSSLETLGGIIPVFDRSVFIVSVSEASLLLSHLDTK
jgi:hypothetical protein